MKKLATVIAFVSSAALAAPVFACPNMDHDEAAAPKTAEKAKTEKTPDQAKAADKTKDAKPADAAKTAKPADTTKKPDKVSVK